MAPLISKKQLPIKLYTARTLEEVYGAKPTSAVLNP